MGKKTAKALGLGFIWRLRLKLWAEGDKLRAEGNKLWAEAILEAHGNIKLEWLYRERADGYACKLETGEVFEPDAKG